MRLIAWWRARRLSFAMREAIKWMKDAEKLCKSLDNKIRRVEDLADDVSAWVEERDRLMQEHKNVVKNLADENRSYSDLLIPTLTAFHELGLKRLEAEIALQVRRTVALSESDKGEGGM